MTAALASAIATAITSFSLVFIAIRVIGIEAKVDRLAGKIGQVTDYDLVLHDMKAAMDRARDMGLDP